MWFAPLDPGGRRFRRSWSAGGVANRTGEPPSRPERPSSSPNRSRLLRSSSSSSRVCRLRSRPLEARHGPQGDTRVAPEGWGHCARHALGRLDRHDNSAGSSKPLRRLPTALLVESPSALVRTCDNVGLGNRTRRACREFLGETVRTLRLSGPARRRKNQANASRAKSVPAGRMVVFPLDYGLSWPYYGR